MVRADPGPAPDESYGSLGEPTLLRAAHSGHSLPWNLVEAESEWRQSISRSSSFGLWEKMDDRRRPLTFDLELTARCNNDCRHCYINLPAGDRAAQAAELTTAEVLDIAGQAAEMGACGA